MSYFDEQVALLVQKIDQWDPTQPFEERVCLHQVSKLIYGQIDVAEEDYQECKEPPCGSTLKRIWRYELETDNGPCDSGELENGVIRGDLVTAEMGESEPGIHVGRFEYDSPTGGRGMWGGTTNLGTHHDPVANCEECQFPHHWEGRLQAIVAHRSGECMVFGTYAHTIDPISIGGSASVSGAFEGLLICKCEA